MKDPYAALQAIGIANAFLTYEIGNLHYGDRLDQLRPQLNYLQTTLSRINAMLAMNPDTLVTFETMSEEDYSEIKRRSDELDKLLAPQPQPVTVVIAAEVNPIVEGGETTPISYQMLDIGQAIAKAITGQHVAHPAGDHYIVDVSKALSWALTTADPYPVEEDFPRRLPHDRIDPYDPYDPDGYDN